MSLILDALRRADAERQREAGQTPGLGATAAASWDDASAPAQRAWRWLALGAVLLLAAAAVAWWWWPGAPPAAVAGAPPPSPVAPAAPAAPAPAEPPLPATVATAPTSASEVELPPMSLRLPEVPPVPAAPARPKPKPAAVRAAAASAVPAPLSPGSAAAASAAEPGAAVAAAAPLKLADLPPDQRAQWPRLVVGGSMYSANVALRMVILDGQLLHEGDNAGPGVVVERIKPRSAVLRAGAQRVEVAW